ncbi:MAG: NAD(P)/FAD-dependent oxidoreductase [Butyrivibrio sp.]|nr:NAD(P)/FAD-dependent oxidoreductase [Butyrivibrio sp.]
MMAAVAAAENGHEVSLYEKNDRLGRKLFITGKGRCNLTNACETEDFFGNVVTNASFLYSSVYSFDNNSVQRFFEDEGCPLKTERGNRVFPVSDKASDVIDALERAMKRLGVRISLGSRIDGLIEENGRVRGISVNGRKIFGDSVILATGGYSYPSTGSTGDGHSFAKALGHTVTKCRPALVPFTAAEEWVKELQGLSLRNCGVTLFDGVRRIYEDFGELLFTHFGVSGPTVLSASSYAAELIRRRPLRLAIDLKPALDEGALDSRILKDWEGMKNKAYSNSLDRLLPKSLIPVVVMRSGIEAGRRVNEIKREERRRLVRLLKNFDLTLTGLRGFNEAIITHGGVSVGEIEPGTMESKLVRGLYFAGEIIDTDAVTGGFNLQIAWSTGHLAGASQREAR